MMRKGNAGGSGGSGGAGRTGVAGRRTMRNSLHVNLGDIFKPGEK
jgi:hypothetical protein